MAEETKTVRWRATRPATTFTGTEVIVPNEPFPCPSCGQMLAPTCRVCVSCRQVIDPAAICRRTAPVAVEERRSTASAVERVRFPWKLFLLVLFFTWAACVALAGVLGLEKLQLVLFIIQIASSAWVFYDAHAKRLPKPFRWAVATLLFWAFMFPWYLARRRAPEASCPFVEAEATRLSKLLLLALCIALIVLLAVRGGPLR